MPHFTFTTLNSVADRLLLAFILGQYFMGIYTAGTTMASVMLMITSAISFSARPQIFSRLAQNTAASLNEIRELSITSMLIIALAGANLALWSPEALTLLTSSAYHNAWQITLLLTLKYMLQGVSVFVLSSILFNKVNVHRLLWVSLSSLLVLIFFSLQLAPHFGIWGVAVAGLMATLYELFFNAQLSKKAFAIRWPIGQMLGIIALLFIPACGLVIVVHWTTTSLWLTLCIKLLFSISSVFLVFHTISRQFSFHFNSVLSKIGPWKGLNPPA
jgi:O-antigen/teichoic acid export membrane protein